MTVEATARVLDTTSSHMDSQGHSLAIGNAVCVGHDGSCVVVTTDVVVTEIADSFKVCWWISMKERSRQLHIWNYVWQNEPERQLCWLKWLFLTHLAQSYRSVLLVKMLIDMMTSAYALAWKVIITHNLSFIPLPTLNCSFLIDFSPSQDSFSLNIIRIVDILSSDACFVSHLIDYKANLETHSHLKTWLVE
jgi:hypothetical protein